MKAASAILVSRAEADYRIIATYALIHEMDRPALN